MEPHTKPLYRHQLENAAIAFTLSNLCYLRVWRWLIFPSHVNLFLSHVDPGPPEIVVATLVVTVLAAVFWPFVNLARASDRRYNRSAKFAVLLGAAAAIASCNVLIPETWNVAMATLLRPQTWTFLKFAFVGIALIAMLLRPGKASRFVCSTVLLLSPFTLLVALKAGWVAGTDGWGPPDRAIAGGATHRGGSRRLLWVILDEWDYRLTYVDRKPGLDLRNLDRLAAESVFARNALSPGKDTLTSVPSLLLGKTIARFEPVSERAAVVRFAGDETDSDYPTGQSIFSAARAHGYSVAVAGWALPYCRLFGKDLARCEMSGGAPDVWFAAIPTPPKREIAPILRSQLEALFTSNLCPLNTLVQRREHFASEFKSLLLSARDYAGDPSLDLVFLHISSPHLPGICRDVLATGCPDNEYLGNLMVADMVVAELRRRLETAGLWEQTALIVSADHPFRHSQDVDGKADPRVPYLVHLPGQHSQWTYDAPLETIVSRDLTLSLLDGELQSPGQVIDWLDNRSSSSFRLRQRVGELRNR